MSFLALIITWLNVLMNAAGRFLLCWLPFVPGWLSNTIISAVVGVILLIVFKYISNQTAIGKVKDSIKANMLALKLFKDSMSVTFQSQGKVFKGAGMLLFYSLKPMLIMIVPVCFILAQMGLWYQNRPLMPGEEALVMMQLSQIEGDLPDVIINCNSAAIVETGPVRIFSKKQIYWKIRAIEKGNHIIAFNIGDEQFEKQLAIGDGFMRVSSMRPGWNWSDILWHPAEKPLTPDSAVASVSIDYPERGKKIAGIDPWLIYFFIASMVFALLLKPILKVKI